MNIHVDKVTSLSENIDIYGYIDIGIDIDIDIDIDLHI